MLYTVLDSLTINPLPTETMLEPEFWSWRHAPEIPPNHDRPGA
jgi:hypothetical protein